MSADYLLKKLGPIIADALCDDGVTEIIVNPDQSIWLVHKTKGTFKAGIMPHQDSTAFVHALASSEDKYINRNTPFLDAVLPFDGERINITIEPLVDAPSFNIRKKAKTIFTLQQYVLSLIHI